MKNLRVSIITVTYNSEKTLRETIESVKAENSPDLEYVIIDGGSTDSTLDIIKQYPGVVTRYVSEPDKGISDAFNKGILMSTGDVIGIINSDDVLYPGAVKTISRIFENQTDIDVVFGKTIKFRNILSDGYIKKPDTDLSKMEYTFLLNHPSVFVSSKAYEKYGMFSLDYRCAMDYELLSRMYFAGAKFYYVDEILSGFREGGESSKHFKTVTLKEHEAIALRNGVDKLWIKKYLRRVTILQHTIAVMKILHIERIIRRIIKGQGVIK